MMELDSISTEEYEEAYISNSSNEGKKVYSIHILYKLELLKQI
jgi:hypothetical protein